MKNRFHRISQKRQQGYAEALVPLMTLIVIGFGILLAASFVVSLLLPLKLKGHAKKIGLTVVIVFWGWQCWTHFGKKKYEEEMRLAARAHCENELNSIPSVINLEGFLDDAAALRISTLRKLFEERRLKFIEVRVQSHWNKPPSIAYPNGQGESGWEIKQPVNSYIRLELSNKDNPLCLELPYGIKSEINRPPFLPNTCIAGTALEKPTARYRLHLEEKGNPKDSKFGTWVLLDSETNMRLVSLTTSDKHEKIAPGGIAPVEHSKSTDCGSPNTTIVNRFLNTNDTQVSPQLLTTKVITADISPDILSADPSTHRTYATETVLEHSVKEASHLYNPEIYLEQWQQSVEKAQRNRWAGYGSKLVDWKNQQLLSLKVKQDTWPWHVLATEAGFFVFSTSREWQSNDENLLVHYTPDGKLVRAVRIETDSAQKENPMCGQFMPRAIELTEDRIKLISGCNTGSLYAKSVVWSISRDSVK